MDTLDWSAGFRRPDKERFLAALRPEEIGAVPYYESNVAPEISSAVLGKRVPLNDPLPPDDAVELARRLGQDVINIAAGWVFGRAVHHDESGRRVFLQGLIHTRDDLKRLQHPSLDTIARLFEAYLPAIEGTGLGVHYSLDTVQGLVIRALGYEHYFLNIYDDPAFLREFNSRVDEWVMASTAFVVEKCPVDVVSLNANICDKNGPMYRPQHIDAFCFEPLRRQLALVQARGIPSILHTDGDNSRLMNDLIDLGIDAIHPVEPCAGFDIYQLNEHYGDRLCLIGNIDLAGVLAFGTPDEVVADTEEHIRRLAPGGGYACGSSHDINYNVPLQNLYAMIKTVSDAHWTPGQRPAGNNIF